jgi:hypothetical protein
MGVWGAVSQGEQRKEAGMTKDEVIARIKAINRSADEEFLQGFSQPVLETYLKRLESMVRQKPVPVAAET